MSGILKKIIRKIYLNLLYLIIAVLCIAAMIAAFKQEFILLFVLILFIAGCVCLWGLNRKICQFMNKQRNTFMPQSNIRNVDYLMIGDIADAEKLINTQASYVQIQYPKMTLSSAFEILRHTHSILKEEKGTVIFAIDASSANKKGFSVFDIPYFHRITIQKYGLEQTKNRSVYPALFDFSRCLDILKNKKISDLSMQECPNEEISTFCKNRGYDFYFYTNS